MIFRIVPGQDWKDDYRETLESKIKDTYGENFRVTFMIADDIPLTPAGKSRFIISRLEERLVIKTKIHKARITGTDRGRPDCLIIDEELMEYGNLVSNEQILIANNTNGPTTPTTSSATSPSM